MTMSSNSSGENFASRIIFISSRVTSTSLIRIFGSSIFHGVTVVVAYVVNVVLGKPLNTLV